MLTHSLIHSFTHLISYFSVATENAVVAKKSLLKVIGPTLASSFVAAALMYPFDLIRALSMANAGSSLTTVELLRNFKNIHGKLLTHSFTYLFTHPLTHCIAQAIKGSSLKALCLR